jgi:DNA-binding transcriptional LysR family regulator
VPTAITLRQLEYFVAVARTRSMAQAATTLHVSPAAVSLGIGELERTLGAQLFLRVRHQPLTLTPAGTELLADASMVVARVEDFEARAVDRVASPSGTLHIGCFATLAPLHLPRLVSAMSEQHPAIRLEATEGSLETLQADILDGTSELALMYGIDLRPGIDADHVAAARPYVVLPHDHRLAGRAPVHLADLADDPMVLLDAPPSRHHALSVLSSLGVTPTIERITRNFETLRSFVARGHGWGFLVQRPCVDSSYEGLPIVCVPIADDIEPVPIVIATAAGNRRSGRAAACIDVWRAILA